MWQKVPLFLTKPMKKCSYRFILRKPSASNVAIDAMLRIKIVGSGAGEAWAAEEAMGERMIILTLDASGLCDIPAWLL
jgi:hypothetical protein